MANGIKSIYSVIGGGTGGSGSEGGVGPGLNTINFLTSDWEKTTGENTYQLSFSNIVVGYNSNSYIATIEKEVDGIYRQTANAVFKAEDGSLAVYGASQPFKGRIVIVGKKGIESLPTKNIALLVNSWSPEKEQEFIIEGLLATDNITILWESVTDEEYQAFGQSMIRAFHNADQINFRCLGEVPLIDINLTIRIMR